jgi:FMN phosphatase YigB (HAD superfamily)
MRLGFDFDNTLISYDQLFHRVALDKSLILAEILKQKNAVRDSMRERGIEEEWTRLQGEVYGSRILDADYAKETSMLAKSMIIQQAATAMLGQANQNPRLVLHLLK